MNIGILLPRSDIHPGIGLEFMDGLKTSLNISASSSPIQIKAESIGFGGSEKEIYEKAEKLLMIEGVDILLAFVDERVLDLLIPVAGAAGKVLVVVNPGANYPQNWVPQPNVIHLTLQHAFLCSLAGGLIASADNKNAALASTFYDCGYLHVASLVNHFIRSGGILTFNYVNRKLYRDGLDISELHNFLSANPGSSNLLCIFDAWPASLFYELLDQTEYANRLHLFASPMMFEPRALEKAGNGFKFSVEGYIPWHSSVDNAASQDFHSRYTKQTKKTPSIFALLGWEAGLLVKQFEQTGNGDYSDGSGLVKQLEGVALDSPRGALKMDGNTQYMIAAPFHCSLPAGTTQLTISAMKDEESDKEWERFSAETVEGTQSGWTNTYLCY